MPSDMAAPDSADNPAELLIWTRTADGYVDQLETELKGWATREGLPAEDVRFVRAARPHIDAAVVVANAAAALLWSLHRRAAAQVLNEPVRRGYSIYVSNQPLLDRRADEIDERRRAGLGPALGSRRT